MAILASTSQDLAYAWRALRRSPLFALIVTVTLAVGIGANSAVLSVIDRAFLRKLPVPDPARIVLVASGDLREGRSSRDVSPSSFPDYLDLRGRLPAASGLAAFAETELLAGDDVLGTISGGGDLVTGNYFQVLGARAERGRLIASDEDQPPGAHPVVVISHELWKSRLGGDEHVVGRGLTIGKVRFTIIGVAPPGFTGVLGNRRIDFWLPYTMQAAISGSPSVYNNRDARLAFVVGRLGAGATLPQLQADLDRAAADLRATYPTLDGSLRLTAYRHDRLVPIEQAPMALATLLLVWAMVLLLHLVACSNVASLVVARTTARRRELGIRLCLGAPPRRVLLHLLAEPAILSTTGAVGGLLVARWLTLLITSMQFMSAMDPGLDLRVVAIVAVTAAATTVGFGLLPALYVARSDPVSLLAGGADGRIAGRQGEASPLLVAGQVALSLILLANAAVLLRAFQRQVRADPGFDARHLVVVSVTLPKSAGLRSDWAAIRPLVTRIGALPGVVRVTASHGAPLFRMGWQDEVLVAGHEYAEGESHMLSVQTVGPGYFATIGTPLVAGREFDWTDRGSLTWQGFHAAVVNEAMARRYWPGQEAVGKLVAFRHRGAAVVVGVVRDIHDIRLSWVVPRVYFPLSEWRMNPGFEFVVRTTGDPGAVRAALSTAVVSSSLFGGPPVVQTMPEIVADAVSVSRVGGTGMAIVAALALLLTAIGLYGLVAGWAVQRTHEIGIRLAMGAEGPDVHRLLVGGAGRLVVGGAILGAGLSAAMIRVERSWWGPTIELEVAPLIGAMLVLAVVAGLAAYLPSRRAAALDPGVVLRSE